MNDKLINIHNYICEVRGRRVMLDSDLAMLYGVETRALKQAVRRNIERFPSDFMFELSLEESDSLLKISRSQIVTLKQGKNTKYKPFAFTEQGVAMLSSVLHSEVAIKVNIAIMRAFIQVREALTLSKSVSAEINELRAKVDLLAMQQEENLEAVNDLSEDVRKDIDNLYVAIGELALKLDDKKATPRSRIGFK
ncbi:MAG: ORF6N domain-containing protein [Marinilabiliaceae bacterium]|nr:ORF6N domain-containing protein [Marinilabiliaceae bacterium]